MMQYFRMGCLGWRGGIFVTGQTLADRAATTADGATLSATSSRTDSESSISLRILGKFDLNVCGRSIPLGATSQRLLTLIVVRSGQIPRGQAAGTLWPETPSSRAAANLRSALWRLQQCCSEVIDASFHDLRLGTGVAVDIHRVSEIVFRLLTPATELGPEELHSAMRANLYEDIAPDIGADEWLIAERERFRQLRVHALEALAGHLLAAGWHGGAIEAALGAVRADPFRESAYYLLIKAHLAEGSRYEARKQHSSYCELLRDELGLAPSNRFMALLDG